jgi:hypothetical protein
MNNSWQVLLLRHAAPFISTHYSQRAGNPSSGAAIDSSTNFGACNDNTNKEKGKNTERQTVLTVLIAWL